MLTQAMTAQANKYVVVPINVATLASRVMNFTRMNPMKFHGSMVEEDPQEFIKVYKVLMIMGVMSVEMAELNSYQLKVLLKYGINNGKKEDLKIWVLLVRRSLRLLFLIGSFP